MIVRQIYIFAVSIIGGLSAAFLYDLIRARRKNFRSRAILLSLEDFVYWIIASIILILAAFISNDGEIRGYIIIGYVCGVILYMLVLSRYILKGLSFAAGLLKKFFSLLFLVVTFPFALIARKLRKPLQKAGVSAGKAAGKAAGFLSSIFGWVVTWTTIWTKVLRNLKGKI